MIRNGRDTGKAAIFSVLVLSLAVGAALLINILGLGSNELAWATAWSITPTVAALIMLLVVTRDGYAKEGWKELGLHRLGLSVWWIAFGATFVITVAASAIVWATPLASFVVPDGGVINPLVGFLIQTVILTCSFALAEEIGMRGYLLPKLLSLGRTRALAVSGLVFATWHTPLIFLTPLYHSAGDRWIVLPLFYGTIVAASFFFGYLRIYTGSLWPASIAHATHNAVWGSIAAFTLTADPVVVNEYLVGDNGILIFAGTVIGALWVRHLFRDGINKVPSAGEAEGTPEITAARR